MSRPILVIDTSVFLQDAFSNARKGAASQVLAIAPAVAHIVMCEEIRDEIFEKVDEYLHWSRVQVLARYAPVLDAALWITPVAEGPHHLKVVQDDPGDTSCPACHHPPALDPAIRKWPCP